ncbi:bifunctional methylenetetrahydrofolate dehydrogenase/methenyltetrahydrofolate cyclohydrolase [candidate division WS6 bacterium RIFOXYB1_FULL_33_14]|uniref:Bifunctional protein FolD n=1 Tax=candidate division WS6 bacterium RIFOXYB1_FULL_33_14 TaxID=1817896 RepID=A0A1F4UH54_9BACT|nr:MAG: bifunctional methylenetetrahydrofolate dehydrogenase/methenyltetrahydrofolate cyclohydrolase [candidate division WS6 bacterium RIFOXYB1_FULL_33_14]
MKILDGKQTSLKISEKIQKEIQEYIDSEKRASKLDILLVGDDFGSQKYVEMKSKKAQELGIQCEVHRFEEDIQEEELIRLIEELNRNDEIDGVMVQLPLPSHINEKNILEKILPSKDVDGLTSVNLGKLFKNDPTAIAPATAKGILELLKEYEIEIDGKSAVVIGRSDIVGLPTVALLQNENATVTVCHSHTKDLKEVCKRADILVVGIGKAEFIDMEYVKEGSVVIDVGTNKNEEGKLVGDVDFESVKNIVEYITPVPGGVGPMTISCLLSNLLDAYKKNV